MTPPRCSAGRDMRRRGERKNKMQLHSCAVDCIVVRGPRPSQSTTGSDGSTLNRLRDMACSPGAVCVLT